MGLQALLSIIENYVALRSEPRRTAVGAASDWDCGLAAEFDHAYADAARKERLEETRAALQEALETYIDERIEAVLARKGASFNRSAAYASPKTDV